MKFRNYCIVVLGDVDGVKDSVKALAENIPNIFLPTGGGCLIATFASSQTIEEIREFFTMEKKNFLIFELNPRTSGYNFTRPDIQEGLFGFLKIFNDAELNRRAKNLMDEVNQTSASTSSLRLKSITRVGRESDASNFKDDGQIAKMTSEEKNNLFNKIMDKGVKNLSAMDRDLLTRLSK